MLSSYREEKSKIWRMLFGNNPFIDSVWIYGSSFESFLVVVVNPSKQQVEKWAK
uniref:Uncharacterized protein n=1 Tax=Solanum lycopersicum TaxID=4081 RepID=A0A3Q7FJM1_SOLLC